MALLESPAENPCFGCGPHHSRGLHLAFERRTGEGGVDEIVCEYAPKPDEIGWPGLMHIGLLFMVLMETSYWAALTLGGKVMTITGPSIFEPRRLPRTGETLRARARIETRTETGARIACTGESLEGKPYASLASTWQRARRSQVERAGIALPSYLLDDMDP